MPTCPLCSAESDSKESVVNCLKCNCSFENEHPIIPIRENDPNEPSEINSDGIKYWKNEKGELHRVGGPAFVDSSNGYEKWVLNGFLHRLDGPAVIHEDLTDKDWYMDKEQWFLNGKFHREDGPAVVGYDRSESWFKHGKRHREDGPARIYGNMEIEGLEKDPEEEKDNYWIDGKEVDPF